MKTLKLIAIAAFLFIANATQAQVSVNVNIGTAPNWGPVGYTNVDYYYIPDVQSYYDIRQSQFIYFGNGKWIRSKYLPRQYRNYDLYSGYKVVLNDYHGRTPYVNYNVHKVKYYKGYKGKPQKNIGYKQDYRNDKKYVSNRKNDYKKHDSDNRRHNHKDKKH